MNPVEILNHHQVKKTALRVSILKALQESPFPLSEHEIKQQIGDLYDRTTFYRSMLTLSGSGIVHKMVADNLLTKYALNHCEHGHHHKVSHVHFYCQNCQMFYCLDEVPVQHYLLPEGFNEQQSDVIIKGLCQQCNQKQNPDQILSDY